MKQRGKILRDANQGTGLLSANGVQHEFALKGVWQSDNPPTMGMTVEFETDASGHVSCISQINENQLAKEQADKLMQDTKAKSIEVIGGLSDRFGRNLLIAWVLLVVAWFFLSVLKVDITANVKTSLSFWDFLALANAGNPTDLSNLTQTGDKGIWGVIAWLALASPILPLVWKDARAHLGQALPFLLMLAVFGSMYFSIQHAIGVAQQAAGALGGYGTQEMVSQIMKAALTNIHIGMGTYVSLVAALFMAVTGLRKFLVARA